MAVQLKNLMEAAVYKAIDDSKTDIEFCHCDKCRLDIAALALNKLPAKYVVTDRGDTFVRADMLDLQNYFDILTVVLAAIKVVAKKPSHEE